MKKCELLVPAGGEKQLIAAVENGADAVYLGGKRFNARINTGNFDDEELQRAVAFAHKRGVSVYVTMNTLIRDEEMREALDYAAFLYRIGVDALIVQDIGLAKVIRESFGDFPLHLSTQGTVYDLRGVNEAGKLGFSRVVLARELSYEEIKGICQSTGLEIEVFVHGAMCICYSGQCQMSRYFGGRSGNRGQCAQPCRLPYKTFDENHRLQRTFQYPLSPKDLCTIDYIGLLAEAGVTSLKIEGRMKSPEYVAVTTSIYRKYLDLYYEKGSYIVSDHDREALNQIFNRGGFTEGYFYKDPEGDFMAGDIPKHRGVKIGKVVKKVQGSALIDVKLYHPLQIGDGVEIQGKNMCGNIITYYKTLKNGLTRIGDIKGEVHGGDEVYRITSKAQLIAAGKTFKHKTFEEGKFLRRTPVECVFSVIEERYLRLTLSTPLWQEKVTVTTGPFDLEKGQADILRIEKGLRKMGNSPFYLKSLEIEGRTDRVLNISHLNDLRRKGLQELERALSWNRKLDFVDKGSLPLPGSSPKDSILEFYFYDWESFTAYQMPSSLKNLSVKKDFLIPAVEFLRHVEEIQHRDDIIPYITNISKGRESRIIEENLDILCALCRKRGIYVGNLSWIEVFGERKIPVYGDYGLNIFNRYAKKAYEDLGIRRCVGSLESLGDGFGNFPLMITQHKPEGKWILDRKKEKIDLVKRDFSDQILLISKGEKVDVKVIHKALKEEGGIIRIYLK